MGIISSFLRRKKQKSLLDLYDDELALQQNYDNEHTYTMYSDLGPVFPIEKRKQNKNNNNYNIEDIINK